MSDTKAIASTIADRFRGLTVPTGQPSLVEATHTLPTGIKGLPSLYVFPPTREYGKEAYAMSTRFYVQSYPVRFYLAQEPTDGPDIDALHDWGNAMENRILTNEQLGFAGTVTWAWIDIIHPSVVTYAGQEYLGLDMVVKVGISEPVTPAV